MELVKEAGEFKIYKKKSGRFCVKNKQSKWVNGDEKTKVLLDQGLIKVSAPKAKPAEEAPAEAAASEEAAAE